MRNRYTRIAKDRIGMLFQLRRFIDVKKSYSKSQAEYVFNGVPVVLDVLVQGEREFTYITLAYYSCSSSVLGAYIRGGL